MFTVLTEEFIVQRVIYIKDLSEVILNFSDGLEMLHFCLFCGLTSLSQLWSCQDGKLT